ncbi:MAG: disulfide bond formation protein B, partial [Actinobacteria bacterium]|nr:disulfide bond formation protein B [Actinomycetota bacterium]
MLAVIALTGALVHFIAARVPVAVAGDLSRSVHEVSLWLAWLVAAVATAGSLYFSEIADYVPCRLCWFQRVCMYPLAGILLVAAIRRDRNVRW